MNADIGPLVLCVSVATIVQMKTTQQLKGSVWQVPGLNLKQVPFKDRQSDICGL